MKNQIKSNLIKTISKNKFLTIFLIFISILVLITPIASANDDIMLINEDVPTNEVTSIATPEVPTLTEDDVYLVGNEFNVDYIIDGNLFIYANNVTISSQIGGDVFVFSDNITITESASISGNLFTYCSQVLTIDGVVYDVYAHTGKTIINGYIYRDVRINSQIVEISGIIGRNAYLDTDDILFNTTETSTPAINGKLDYYTELELLIPDTYITGEVTKYTPSNFTTSTTIVSLFYAIVVLTVILWVILKKVAPKFHLNSSLISIKSILLSFVIGVVTVAILSILTIFTILPVVTVPISILCLTILVLLILVSIPCLLISVSNSIVSKIKNEKIRTQKGLTLTLSALLSLIVFVLSIIPTFGNIFLSVLVVLGIGLIIKYTFKKNRD